MDENLKEVISCLDKQASSLQDMNKTLEAELLDSITNTLEIKMASDEVSEYDSWCDHLASEGLSDEELVLAFGEKEAAEKKKKKKKWIPKNLEEGRLTKYRKPGESMEEAARRAQKSGDPSLAGAGSLYLNVFAKRKRKRKQKGKDS